MHDWLTLVAMLLGSGVGITGLKYAHSVGKKEALVNQKADELAELKKKLEEREEIDELVRTLDRDFGGLKEDLKEFLTDHATAREEDARTEERVLARVSALEGNMSRINKFFSQTFPRARTASRPDITDDDKEK